MHLATRLTVTALVVVTLLGLLVFACPGVFARLGINVGELPRWLRMLDQERARCRDLDDARAAVDARIRGKEEVARDLIDGRVSRVRELCAASPEVLEVLGYSVAGSSDAERLCRHLIDCGRDVLADEPERAAAFAARIEGEIARLLREHGTVVLP
jgi:hypothetical protein